jgi:hypothetical protein
VSIIIIIFISIFCLFGCGSNGQEKQKLSSAEKEQRQREVFWQFTEPKIQLDPIQEQEFPTVIEPVYFKDKQNDKMGK